MADINSGSSGTQQARDAYRGTVQAGHASSRPADDPLIGLVELLFFAYRDFTGEADAVLQEFGFGRAHHRVLHFVNRRPGLRVADLLDILRITKQSLARVLKQLVDRGFIAQAAGSNDRRERLLYLTPRGEALAAKLAELQIAQVGRALSTAGPEGENVVRDFLLAMIGPEQRASIADGTAARPAKDQPVSGADAQSPERSGTVRARPARAR